MPIFGGTSSELRKRRVRPDQRSRLPLRGRSTITLNMSGRTRSALHADHLLERMDQFGQVALVRHHLVDVLVRARDLVDHATVLAALDARGLCREVELAEAALRLGP